MKQTTFQKVLKKLTKSGGNEQEATKELRTYIVEGSVSKITDFLYWSNFGNHYNTLKDVAEKLVLEGV